MPELPEVEIIVRDLQEYLTDKKIKDFELFNKKTINLSAAKFKQQILNQTIKQISRSGKNIIIKLPENYLVIHLKMTGQLILKIPHKLLVGGHPITKVGQSLPNKFTRAVFTFTNNTHLYFNDVRKFGWIKLMSKVELDKYLDRLGIEPLNKSFSFRVFQDVLQSKQNSLIKPALLDQTRIAGLGNIYVDESLFLAGIKPQRKIATLTKIEQEKLWQAIPKILRQSIKYRGTSFNDYVDARGQSGQFVKHLKVYNRAGQACYQCSGLISKIKLGGRGTHWCDNCQK